LERHNPAAEMKENRGWQSISNNNSASRQYSGKRATCFNTKQHRTRLALKQLHGG